MSCYGPGGPAAICRIDLATGDLEWWHLWDAGLDRHDLSDPTDEAASEWVGRSGLGDIELSPDGGALFVANLHDGRIYCLSTVENRVVTSFASGAAADMQLPPVLGLGYSDGWPFHGVADMRPFSRQYDDFVYGVYRSGATGLTCSKRLRSDSVSTARATA